MFGSFESVDEIIDARDGLGALDCCFVESSVVYAQPKCAIGFFDKDDRSADRGRGMGDVTGGEVVVDVLLEGFSLTLRDRVDRTSLHFSSEFDLDIIRSMWGK